MIEDPPVLAHPQQTRGRQHPETQHLRGDPFQLDRHRILASTAFRRLQYKTQVFVDHRRDHFRTRLTHTIEVAHVARRLAAALNLNQALAEAVALAHDLGHPPFGHAGETALRKLMAGAGGFEHNLHTLRVVDFLEHPYPDFRGLNLSFEVREGILKHATRYDRPQPLTTDARDLTDLVDAGTHPTLEAQLVCIADRMAYDCHDLEDALGAEFITEPDLADVTLWSDAARPIRERSPDANVFAVRRPILDGVLDHLMADCVTETATRLRTAEVKSVADVRRAPHALVDFSAGVLPQLHQLEDFLAERFYRHPRVVRTDAAAGRIIHGLFTAYLQNPATLPQRFAARLDHQGPHRVICDYIAGMTDRFCRRDYKDRVSPDRRI